MKVKLLSTEEKARRYDEVVERLKDFRFEYRFSAFGDVIEEKFPELAESEDEKIRKELIRETKGSEIKLFEAVTNEEFVAWLERQREQKTAWKPSSEQMKFLWKYAEQNNYDGRILTSLYNDLKKLKGM